MTSYSTHQPQSPVAGEDAALPPRPDRDPLNERTLGQVCAALSEACCRAHQLFVDTLKSEKFPSVITKELSISESARTTEGVLALSDEERRALLQLAQDSLRASGTALVGGITDFISYAHKFSNLSTPPKDQGEQSDTVRARTEETIHLVNSLAGRLIVSLSTATCAVEKQQSIVGLNGLITACRPTLKALSAELDDAMSRALAAGAEMPAWAYGR